MPLKFKIKDEQTDYDSLNLTVETISKGYSSGIICEDSKVGINLYTELTQNMDIIVKEKHLKSTNIISREVPLKFEIKDELTDDNYSKCSQEYFIPKTDHCGVTVKFESIVFRDTFGTNFTTSEGAPLNDPSANKMPLKLEIKDEPMDYNSLNLTECVDDAVHSLYMGDDSKNSNIGHLTENKVLECVGKSVEDEKQISVNDDNHKVATKKKYHCDICNKNFTRSTTLKIHQRIHTGEKPHQCDVCNKCFNQSSSLNLHKRIHTGEKPYQCDVCKKCFSISGDMLRHKRTHTGEKPYKCDVCNKSFSMSSYLNSHNRTHTGEKPYQCEVCNKCFNNYFYLNRRKRGHTGEKPYKCDVCNKSFSVPYTLNNHKLVHTGEKPYQCDVCYKSFSLSTHLINHTRTHTGEKPYRCDVCSKCFSQSGNKSAQTHAYW